MKHTFLCWILLKKLLSHCVAYYTIVAHFNATRKMNEAQFSVRTKNRYRKSNCSLVARSNIATILSFKNSTSIPVHPLFPYVPKNPIKCYEMCTMLFLSKNGILDAYLWGSVNILKRMFGNVNSHSVQTSFWIFYASNPNKYGLMDSCWTTRNNIGGKIYVLP